MAMLNSYGNKSAAFSAAGNEDATKLMATGILAPVSFMVSEHKQKLEQTATARTTPAPSA
jgi:hypothetical protein